MKEKMKEKLPLVIIVAIVIVAVAGVAFYGGLKYGSSRRISGLMGGNFQSDRAGAGAGIKNRPGVGPSAASGDITAQDDKSITIKLRDGGSKIIFFSSSTEVGKFVVGALADLSVGESVMVSGKTNADGSVTAQSIQIRPAEAVEPAMPPQQ